MLNSDENQPSDPRDQTDATGETHDKHKWVMTPAAFNKLLNAFSEDRDEAGRQYERARTKLCRFFEWHSVGPGDDLADEAFNRVARRLEEGHKVENLLGFLHGVANMIWKEVMRRPPAVSLDAAPEVEQQMAPEPAAPDIQQDCLDACLEVLSSEKHNLILAYYQQELRQKIAQRQKLAKRLGIPSNALRIRAHRIRMTLEECIIKCLETKHAETNRPF